MKANLVENFDFTDMILTNNFDSEYLHCSIDGVWLCESSQDGNKFEMFIKEITNANKEKLLYFSSTLIQDKYRLFGTVKIADLKSGKAKLTRGIYYNGIADDNKTCIKTSIHAKGTIDSTSNSFMLVFSFNDEDLLTNTASGIKLDDKLNENDKNVKYPVFFMKTSKLRD